MVKIKKTNDDTETRYYYSNNWQVLEERDGDGYLIQWYAWGNYIDELLIRSTGTTIYDLNFYLHDHLYSPAVMAGWGGFVGGTKEYYEYDAYGKPLFYTYPGPDYIWFTEDDYDYIYDDCSAYGTNYLFTGREVDCLYGDTLKIQYNRNRYLDYYTGRWMQQDPLGYINGLNLYIYVKNNPIRFLDSFGLEIQTVRK